MSKVAMVATFNCQEGKNDEMDAALAMQVAAMADQDGVEIYSYHRGEGTAYSFFAILADRSVMETSNSTDAMQAAMAVFGPLLDGPPNMTMGAPVSAKGFEV